MRGNINSPVRKPHVMILAGEASGDAHAAEFVRHIRRLRPDVRLSGMGCSLMKKAGVDVFFDSTSIAVMGLVEVLKHWGDIKRAMARVRQAMEDDKPDLLVLVDYPDFNLKMAEHARKLDIKVLYYISPKVWAWRPKRIHKIGRLIDHMALIFKFELSYYESANIPASFVGHPLVGKVQASRDREQTLRTLGIQGNPTIVGLFPGSRNSEIHRLMPLMLETAQKMRAQNPAIEFILPVASTLDRNAIAAQCTQSGVDICVSETNIYDLIPCCDAIVSCSGTVNLEIALLGIPMCVVYKTAWLSHKILKRLVKIPHVCLVNIIAKREVVREFLQQDASTDRVSSELFKILEDSTYANQIRTDLKQVCDDLGKGSGSEAMAELVLSFIPH